MTGEDIRAFRVRHGLRQTQLARLLLVDVSEFSKWESGQKRIPHWGVMQLALAAVEAVLTGRLEPDARMPEEMQCTLRDVTTVAMYP